MHLFYASLLTSYLSINFVNLKVREQLIFLVYCSHFLRNLEKYISCSAMLAVYFQKDIHMHTFKLSFELSQIINRIFIDLRPFLWKQVEEVVLDITLDHDLVVSRHGSSASKLRAEKFGSHLQIDI